MGERRDIPMEYVRSALNDDEKIVHIARFHWFYDLMSWVWMVFGLLVAIGILAGAAHFVLHVDLDKAFPNIKPEQADDAIAKIINHYGGWLGIVTDLHWGVKTAAALCLCWGVLTFLTRTIIKYTTEIAVTTVRLIYKHGVIARFVGEMKLDRLESINVYQSFFGRIFNYGRVMVHGVGIGEVILPEVAEPMRLRKALDYARNKIIQERRLDIIGDHEGDGV